MKLIIIITILLQYLIKTDEEGTEIKVFEWNKNNMNKIKSWMKEVHLIVNKDETEIC